MLVLSRKRGESVKITDEITVTIVEIRGDKVRVGITAPKDIPVNREEVWEKMKHEEFKREEEKRVQDASNKKPM